MKNITEYINESYSNSTFVRKLKQYGEITENELKQILGDDYELTYNDKHITSLHVDKQRLYACYYDEDRKMDMETEANIDGFDQEDSIDKIYDFICKNI